ncbi:MAG: hypothetical protein ACTSRU_19285 [Candidatus Hodarchaeales archaeon]
MLIEIEDMEEVEAFFRESIIGQVLTSVCKTKKLREERIGFYHNFSAAQSLLQHIDEWEEWDSFSGVNRHATTAEERLKDVDWTNYRDNYGVCDNIDQILKRYPELEQPDRYFMVTLKEIRREDQPDRGGWRWHKWGEYIGDQKSEHEYLYDEEIDSVICFHIYEQVENLKVDA